MTRRMVAAVRNPHVDVLGHCTGRLIGRTGRGTAAAESEFDALAVFGACRRRRGRRDQLPARSGMDPPDRLLAWPPGWAASSPSTPTRTRRASWTGWATARPGPGRAGIGADRVINTRGAAEMAAGR